MSERAERIAEILGWHKKMNYAVAFHPEDCRHAWLDKEGQFKAWACDWEWRPDLHPGDALWALMEWAKGEHFFAISHQENRTVVELGKSNSEGWAGLLSRGINEDFCEAICAALEEWEEEGLLEDANELAGSGEGNN